MNKKTRNLVNHIVDITSNYDRVAREAILFGLQTVYIPANFDQESWNNVVQYPEECLSQGGNPEEPVYKTFEEGLVGKNGDGSPHGGFIVIDIVSRTVVRVIDRKGVPMVKV